MDSSGNVVEYVYDAAGNIVQINRSTVAAGAVAVFNFTTMSGAPGTLVTIQGQGFSTNPALNTVMFNGVAATVISASGSTLVVVVPAGATSGPISVTVGGNTSTSSTSFNITTLPPGTTLPTVSIASLTNGQSVVQGQTINIALNVTAGSSPVQTADISAGGQFLINGLGVPYRRNFTVPYGVTSLTIGARVRDQAGNYGAATPITLTVVADPLTAVQGTVQDKNGNNITGASVAVKLNGLKAEFFAFGSTLTTFPDLTGLTPNVVKTVSALDFRNPGNLFSTDTFGVNLGNNFAARFTGTLKLDVPGNFAFTLGAAGGAKLLINGALVTTTLGPIFNETIAAISLSAGSLPIEVDYFQSGAAAQVQLSFRSPTLTSNEKRPVPPERFLAPDAFTGTSGTGGAFSFSGVPSNLGAIQVFASGVVGSPVLGQSNATPPAGGGTTTAGTVVLHKAIATSASGVGTLCMVTSTGAGYCWGNGFLGDGQFHFSATPVPVAGGLTWAYIAASGGHTCGITTTGAGYCWGNNDSGQLGNNSTNGPLYVPTSVAGGLTFASIAVGANNDSCGITTSGQAYCWGNNGFGKLGDGTFVSFRTVPTPVTGGLLFTAISPNFFHSTCALATDSQAYCWGLNDKGQLGLGGLPDTNGHSVPALVTGGLTFSAIGTGFNQSCGVSTGGPAYCWGGDNVGQLGDGTTNNSTVPVLVFGGFIFADVSGGNGFSLASRPPHTCGVTTTGVGLCWGFNGDGELGNGTNNNTFLTPQMIVGGLQFVHVIGGDGASMGLTSSGLIYQWGTTPAIVPDPN